MRRGARGARHRRRHRVRPGWAVSALAAPALGALLLSPPGHAAASLAVRLATAAATVSRHAPAAPRTTVAARAFAGTPAVGALFRVSSGRLGRHFCTASVVDSQAGDLVITAAHCVSKLDPATVAFVPGFRRGKMPYGAWPVAKIMVDGRWRDTADPGHDVAFLVLRPAGTTPVQRVTGGERLGTGWPARIRVHVAGYPDRAGQPVICQRRTRAFGPSQLKFVCGGFTDGTSGGPFLARLSASTGEGVVIGVIGGYEQGGDLASVSYSPRFGRAVRALYDAASRQG
jgi:V8-like Glu-specific endopeptidase